MLHLYVWVTAGNISCMLVTCSFCKREHLCACAYKLKWVCIFQSAYNSKTPGACLPRDVIDGSISPGCFRGTDLKIKVRENKVARNLKTGISQSFGRFGILEWSCVPRSGKDWDYRNRHLKARGRSQLTSLWVKRYDQATAGPWAVVWTCLASMKK